MMVYMQVELKIRLFLSWIEVVAIAARAEQERALGSDNTCLKMESA